MAEGVGGMAVSRSVVSMQVGENRMTYPVGGRSCPYEESTVKTGVCSRRLCGAVCSFSFLLAVGMARRRYRLGRTPEDFLN